MAPLIIDAIIAVSLDVISFFAIILRRLNRVQLYFPLSPPQAFQIEAELEASLRHISVIFIIIASAAFHSHSFYAISSSFFLLLIFFRHYDAMLR